MLGGIRAAQSTWIGKALTTLVFGVILVAFVIWGIGDPFRGGSANTVAEVGDVKVSTEAYRQTYQVELQRLQRQARRAITNEEAHRIGLDVEVLSRLVSDAALDDRAKTLDLAISDKDIARKILADPSFAGPGGSFDRARFNAVLAENGLTEAAFVRDQPQVYMRRELIEALVGNLQAPAAAVEAVHRYQDETRSVDTLALPAAAAGPVPAPDDAALAHYYEEHKGAFSAPQYRKLVVLALDPGRLAKPDAVPEADVRALYDRVKAERFGTPETRHVGQLVFPSEEAAAAFVKRVRSGESFADALKAEGLGDKLVDLGTVTKDAIFDRAVADAAFGLPDGGTSDPVKGTFGIVVAHVDAVSPANLKPYESVAPELRTELATTRASADVRSLRDRIEDARSAGKTLAEAAAAVGLEVRTIPAVDAAGNGKDGKPVADLPDGPDLLKAAFASDVGVDNDTIAMRDGGTVWFEVAGIEPARELPLAEARPKVEAVWREEETARRLDAKAADFVKAIDAGSQTIEAIAASLGLSVVHVADVKRAGASNLTSGEAARIFDVPVGAAGSAPTGATSRSLFKVLDSVTPPLDPEAPGTKQIEQRYASSLQDGVLNAYLGMLRARLGAKVNEGAMRAASGAAGS